MLATPLLIASSILMSVAYAYLTVYVPIAGYVSLLFVLGMGFGVVLSLRYAAKISRCRSPALLKMLGVAMGLLTLYVSWACFEYVMLSRYDDSFDASLFDVLQSPQAVWEIMLQINETGWYSIRNSTPTGWLLWVFWGMEALAIVGAGLVGGAIALDDEVYCERCARWLQDSKVDVRLGLPEDGTFETLVQRGIDGVEQLPSVNPSGAPHLRALLKECTGCADSVAMKLVLVTHETDKDGQVQEKTTDVIGMSNLDATEHQRVKALADRPMLDASAA